MPTDHQTFYEARIKGTLHGSQTVNVLHFGTPQTQDTHELLVAFLTQLAQAIIQCVIDFWIPAATSDWTLEGVDVKRIHPMASDPIEISAPVGTVGLRGPVNASFECVVIRKKTGLGGKRNRGRNFFPPPGDADITNSVLTSDPVNDFMSQFLTCIAEKFFHPNGTEPTRLILLSPTTLAQNNQNYNGATNNVIQMNIEQRVSSLRSRKLGIGG